MNEFFLDNGDNIVFYNIDISEKTVTKFYNDLKLIVQNHKKIKCFQYKGYRKSTKNIGDVLKYHQIENNEENLKNIKLIVCANYLEFSSMKDTVLRFLTLLILYFYHLKKTSLLLDFCIILFSKREDINEERNYLKNEYYYISFAYRFFTNSRIYYKQDDFFQTPVTSYQKAYMEIDNRIIAYHENEYKHLSRAEKYRVERIITQIPLTPLTYRVLTINERQEQNMVRISANHEIKILDRIIDNLREKVCDILPRSEDGVFLKIIENECRLVKIFYLLTILEVLRNMDKKNQAFQINQTYENLFEYCRDVCQGLQQIIENSILHSNPTKGTYTRSDSLIVGILTIRVRENANYLKLNSEDFRYIIECYINDIQYGEFCSMPDRFITNAINNSKWNIEGKYTDDLLELQKNMNLKNFFAYLSNPPRILQQYYRDSKNISNHYGLPIFFNIIKNNNGYVKVKCKDDTFESVPSQDFDYVLPDYNYIDGIEYTILSPVRISPQVSTQGYVSVQNLTPTDEKIAQLTLEWSALFRRIDDLKVISAKEKNIETIKDYILESVDDYRKNNSIKDLIVVFDCIGDAHPSYQFEVLIKAIFLILCQEKLAIKKIALLRLQNQYDVLNIVRFFGLFFDRMGVCEALQSDCAIFVADKRVSSHILLYGKKLSSIKENLSKHMVFGGISEQFLTLIDSIIRRN